MTDVETRLAVLEAQAEIRQLAARYSLAVDRRDTEVLQALFAPGAVVVLPSALAGPGGDTEITDPASLLAPLTRFERTRHAVTQQVININGDTATGETYGVAHHLYRRGGELRDYALALRYRDAFACTGEGWRFTRRELEIDWALKLPVLDPASTR
jgi:hypothetical protein